MGTHIYTAPPPTPTSYLLPIMEARTILVSAGSVLHHAILTSAGMPKTVSDRAMLYMLCVNRLTAAGTDLAIAG